MIHPSLLREVELTESPVNINGVGGLQFSVDEEGYLDVSSMCIPVRIRMQMYIVSPKWKTSTV